MHLEFSGCAADFSDDVKWHAGIGILCITDLNISNVVVTNSTGWGVLANKILGSSQIHNSIRSPTTVVQEHLSPVGIVFFGTTMYSVTNLQTHP